MYAMRQGDVILIYAAPINAADRPLERFLKERQVLPDFRLEGNHAALHSIANGQAELYQEDGSLYLQVLSTTAQLVHEVYGTIEVPQGIWLVWTQPERASSEGLRSL